MKHAEGHLGEHTEDTIRYFTNRLTGDQVKRYIFRRYWTRGIVVGVLSQQMRLVLNRQKWRSPGTRRSLILPLALTVVSPPCPAVGLWVPIAARGAFCPLLASRSRIMFLLFLGWWWWCYNALTKRPTRNFDTHNREKAYDIHGWQLSLNDTIYYQKRK